MSARATIVRRANQPLLAAVLTGELGRLTRGPFARAAFGVSQLSLLYWGAEELTTGRHWWQRLLGLAAISAGAAGLRAGITD